MTFHFTEIQDSLQSIGIELLGVADGRAYQTYLSNCQSVLVFGSTGQKALGTQETLFWNCFKDWLRQYPNWLKNYQHPLDQFVRYQLVDAFQQAMGVCHGKDELEQQLHQGMMVETLSLRWIQCSALDDTFIDFRLLAESAGLGWRSPTGLLIHPQRGLWTGLRYACLTDRAWPPTPLTGESPCINCHQPCVEQCPASAVTASGFNYQACSDYNQQPQAQCHQSCLARNACPIGQHHRYSDLQNLYHHHKRAGRAQLAKTLNIPESGETAKIDILPWQ